MVDITIMIKTKGIRKLNNNHGMTLTEVLCATLLVGLVSLCLATGVTLASKQFTSSIRLSEAQELYATLESLLSNELRYTNEVRLTDTNEVDTFFSVTYALKEAKTKLYALDQAGNVTNDYGELALGDEESKLYNRLLGNASYTNKLGAKATIIYNQEKQLFTVNLDIGVVGGDSVVQKSFDVRAMNNVIVGDAS